MDTPDLLLCELHSTLLSMLWLCTDEVFLLISILFYFLIFYLLCKCVSNVSVHYLVCLKCVNALLDLNWQVVLSRLIKILGHS